MKKHQRTCQTFRCMFLPCILKMEAFFHRLHIRKKTLLKISNADDLKIKWCWFIKLSIGFKTSVFSQIFRTFVVLFQKNIPEYVI